MKFKVGDVVQTVTSTQTLWVDNYLNRVAVIEERSPSGRWRVVFSDGLFGHAEEDALIPYMDGLERILEKL